MDIKDGKFFGNLLFTSGTFTASAGTTLDLRLATVQLPDNAIDATKLAPFGPATTNAAGTKGAVPAPAASVNPAGMFLNAAGGFSVPGAGGSGIDPDIVDATSKSDDFSASALAGRWTRHFYPYALPANQSLLRLTSFNYQPGGFVQEVESFGEPVELTGLLWQIVGKVRFTGGTLPPDGSSGGVLVFNAEAGTNNPGQPGIGLCLRTVAGAVHIVSEYSAVVTDAPQDPGGFDVTLPGSANSGWVWLKLDGYGRAYYSLDGSSYTFLGTVNYNAPVAGAGGSGSVILAGGNITYAGFYTRAVTNTVAGVSLDCDSFYCELHSHNSLAEGVNLMSNPMTAAGDLIVGIAGGAPARLAGGTNGFVLTMAGGVPVWAAAAAGGGGGLADAPNDGKLYGRKSAGWVEIVFTSGGSGTVQTDPLPYGSDGDSNGLFYHLGLLAGGSAWVNPAGTAYLTLTASGAQFQGNNTNINTVTDRAVQTGVGNYDCVILGDNSNPCWLQFDLGATRKLAMSNLSFRNRGPYNSDGTTVYVPCYQVTMSGSNDGVNFVNLGVLNIASQTPSAWTSGAVGSAVAYRYIRATDTGSGGTAGFAMGEMELYGTLSTTTGTVPAVLTGAVVSSAPYSDLYAPAHAFDGDTTTQWAGAAGANDYIGLTFTAMKTFTQVSIWPRDGDLNGVTNAYLQTSQDAGATWATVMNLPNTCVQGQYNTFSLPPNTTGNGFRMLGSSSSRAALSELQIYGY